jgi:small GTP-binding protein
MGYIICMLYMTSYQTHNTKINIILAGDSNVGKTTFFNRIKDITYNGPIPTIGVDFMRFYKKHKDETVKLCIWDTSGQEKYHSIISGYFKKISGIILMFDLNKYETYINLQKWIDLIHDENICEHPHPILLIGNKSELTNIIHPNKDLESLKNNENVIYKELSCINCKYSYLEELIDLLITKILKIKNCKGMLSTEYSDKVKITETKIKNKKKWLCNIF